MYVCMYVCIPRALRVAASSVLFGPSLNVSADGTESQGLQHVDENTGSSWWFLDSAQVAMWFGISKKEDQGLGDGMASRVADNAS